MRQLSELIGCPTYKKGLCLRYDSAYTVRPTPTAAFDGAIRYFAYTMWTH